NCVVTLLLYCVRWGAEFCWGKTQTQRHRGCGTDWQQETRSLVLTDDFVPYLCCTSFGALTVSGKHNPRWSQPMKIRIFPLQRHQLEAAIHAKRLERKSEEKKISHLKSRLLILIQRQSAARSPMVFCVSPAMLVF